MPKLSPQKDLDILSRECTTPDEKEEQRLIQWLQDRKELININKIEQQAGLKRQIAMVMANLPNRRLIKYLDKIIPIVIQLGYKPKHPRKNEPHNKV